jgi:hypothetical protein
MYNLMAELEKLQRARRGPRARSLGRSKGRPVSDPSFTDFYETKPPNETPRERPDRTAQGYTSRVVDVSELD